ncbi:MAG: anti-sigma factor family protein [Bacteroidales bacterium]
MKCKKVNKNMMGLLDGTLDSNMQGQIQNHLNSCTKCYKEFNALKDIYAAIEIEKDEFKANPFMAQKIWDRIHSPQAKLSGIIIPIRRMAIASIAAAGIVFGIAIGSLLNNMLFNGGYNTTEQEWSQLADDYFPNQVFSPYDELVDDNK